MGFWAGLARQAGPVAAAMAQSRRLRQQEEERKAQQKWENEFKEKQLQNSQLLAYLQAERLNQPEPDQWFAVESADGIYQVNRATGELRPAMAGEKQLQPKPPTPPFSITSPNWSTVQTDSGLGQVNPQTGDFRPITGGGEQVQPPQPRMPTPVVTAMGENRKMLGVIDDAITQLAAYPDAVGLKGVLPEILLQRKDPQGVAARASIADIGSQVIHDRSGAAVTVSEFPRLAPFVPNRWDTAETVQKKLKRMREIIAEESAWLEANYRSGPRRSPDDDNPYLRMMQEQGIDFGTLEQMMSSGPTRR